MNKFLMAVLCALILIVNSLRFLDLAEIPAGYHVDEYSAAVTTRCFALEGTNAWGTKAGAFFSVAYGSPRPAIYIWPGALVGKVFGFSVPVLRAFSAFMVTLGVLAIFLIGRSLGGVFVGLWAALSASLAPHIFVMSRVGFESLLGAVFMSWAVYFLINSKNYLSMIAAAVCISFSACSYPPARLFLPIFLVLYFVLFQEWKGGIKIWIVFLLVLIGVSLPLIHAVMTDEAVMRRFQEISLMSAIPSKKFSVAWVKEFWVLFWHNYGLHLKPSFLFSRGDASAVHSTTQHGLFSFLDYIAWLLGVLLLGRSIIKKEERPFDPQARMIVLCVLGFFLSIIPSALTMTEIPNALRISMNWPLVSLLTGILVAQAQQRWSYVVWPALASALVFAYFFLTFYFRDYPQISTGMFHDWVVEDAKKIKTSEDWLMFLVKYRYKDYHIRYFLMNQRGEGCMKSLEIWTNVYNNLGQGERY